MEEIYRVVTRPTYETIKEGYTIYLHKIKRQTYYMQIVIGILIIITGIVALFNSVPMINVLILFAIGVGFLLAIYNLPKTRTKQQTRIKDWDTCNTYKFYQNYFVQENYKTKSRLEYEKIQAIDRNENTLTILYNQQIIKLLLIFESKNFLIGDFNDFIVFIENKIANNNLHL